LKPHLSTSNQEWKLSICQFHFVKLWLTAVSCKGAACRSLTGYWPHYQKRTGTRAMQRRRCIGPEWPSIEKCHGTTFPRARQIN